MAALQGYLAAVYKSLATAVGGSELHQLLTNPSFETGDTTGWTTTGTVTVGTWGRGPASLGAKIVDDGTGAGVEQTVTLDNTLTSATYCIARCFAKLPSGATATLKVTALDATETELGSDTQTISSTPYIPPVDEEWGLWSIYYQAPAGTKKLKIEATSSAAMTWYVDEFALVLLEQILGAHSLELSQSRDRHDITAYDNVGPNGERSFMLGLENAEITTELWWPTTTEYTEIDDDTEYFCILFHRTGGDKSRHECWVKLPNLEAVMPLDGPQTRRLTMQVVSVVGATKES